MNTTLAVVVSAIVILITALVVITIFSGGVGQVGSLTNARTVCETQGRSSCLSTGQLPLIWDIPTVSIPVAGGGNEMVPCSDSRAAGCKGTCGNCNYPTSQVTGGGGVSACTDTCLPGASCPAGKTLGSGNCPSGQVCCK